MVERGQDFDATAVKDLFQGSMDTQMTLLRMTDRICEDLKARIGIDRAKGTYPAYYNMRRTLGEFIRVQIIPCYAHRIRIGSARIAGKQEEVTHKG